jgi:hypothetical protein
LLNVSERQLWEKILCIGALAWAPMHRDRTHSSRNWLLQATRLAFTVGRAHAAEPVRHAVLLAGLESADTAVRAEAAELLGLRAESAALPQLERLLHDRDDHVRAAAMRAIACMPDVQELPVLLEAIRSGDVVSMAAMVGLERVGAAAVPDLLVVLREGNRWARWHAAMVLGHIKDPRAIRPLIETLRDDDAGVRWQAVYALAAIGPAVLPVLCAVLQAEPISRRLADDADRVLRRTAHGDLWRTVVPLHEALTHLNAMVEAPVAAYTVRRALHGPPAADTAAGRR